MAALKAQAESDEQLRTAPKVVRFEQGTASAPTKIGRNRAFSRFGRYAWREMVGRPSPAARRFDPARLLARILCVVFGLVGVLPLAAGLFVELEPVQRWASAETARVLKEQLGVQASFEVQLHIVPLRLRVEHLVVPASDGGTPALSVERVSVTPRLFSLLAGRLDIGDVEVESPRARLVIEKGELKNVRYRLPKTQAKKTKTTSSPFGSISVNDGRFTLDIDGTRVDTGTVDLDVFAEAGPAFEVMLSGSGATIARSRKPTRTRFAASSCARASKAASFWFAACRCSASPISIRNKARHLRAKSVATLWAAWRCVSRRSARLWAVKEESRICRATWWCAPRSRW